MPYTSNINLQNLPPWYEAISRSMLERAQGLSRSPYMPFGGPRVAGLNADLNRAEALGRQEGLYLPYLNQAQQGYQQAATPFYQNYQNYLNPYIQSVLDRQRTEGLRTFNEGIMPALDSRFIQGGHFGGGMHRELSERAARDVQKAIADRQQQTLASNFQQAAQMHASDSDRRLQAAARLGNLGQQRQAGHLADISALESQGERARSIRQQDLDIGYRDFLRQSEYPWSQISNLSGAIVGTPHSSQGLQYYHTPPQPQLNRAGEIGQLAGQLYGLNRYAGNNFKKGGTVTEVQNKKVGTVKEGLKMLSGLSAKKKKKGGKC